MRAHGTDRVRRAGGERLVLASRLSKGWVPRVEKTLTTAQFPGTAVLWEEQYFEVVDARALPQGGIEYVLEPWLEHHVMRVVESYDDASEAARIAEHRAHLAREKGRKTANLLALFTGHLPAIVQNDIAENYGILAARVTFVSILGEWTFVGGLVFWIVSYYMRQQPPPAILIVVIWFFAAESTVRFLVNYTQGRPVGSTIGLVLYTAWWLVTGMRARSPFAVSKGYRVVITDAPEERRLQDQLIQREALMTLLPAHDQRRIAERFGYDYRRQSAVIAAGILVFGILGVVSSVMRGAVVSGLVAGAVSAEQIYRLAVLRGRPVGSVFGVLVRPFMRRFL